MRRLEFRQRYFTDIGSIHRCSYFSVIAMIGDVALKIPKQIKRYLRPLEFRQRYFTDIGSIHRCSYFSVIAMIGDVALKIRQPFKSTEQLAIQHTIEYAEYQACSPIGTTASDLKSKGTLCIKK